MSERSRWFHIDTPAAPEAVEGDDPDGEDDDGAPGGPGKRANVSEPDGEDLPNNDTTTGEVDVGGSVTGNIGTGTDGDWFKVVLEAGTRYQIDLEGADTSRGTLPDPRMGLYYSDALVGSLSNDEGVGKNARRIYTPTAGGAYYVRAQNSDGSDTGTYTLSVILLGANGASEADTDFPTTTATTGEVDVGGSVTGNIAHSTDLDWFAVVLEAGKTYQIDLEGEYGGGGTLEDPLLRNIRDSSGAEIEGTSNDDADYDNGIYDSQITFTPTAAGTHYLVASRAGSSTGTYTLSVREFPPPCTLNTGDIWCGVVTVGELKTSADVLVGHGFADSTSLSAGGLAGYPDDTMFSVGDNDYTISGAYIQVPTADHLTGTLFVLLSADLTDDEKAGLVLTVDDTTTTFEFSRAAKGGITGLYSWGLSGLTWSAGDTVTIRVRPRTLSIADAAATEGSPVTFTVTLSAAAAATVTATWTASIETGDTAVAADLGATKTGMVTVAIGDTDARFTVATVEDTTVEVNETFTVTLSGVSSNAQLSSTAATAQGTINNDDLATVSVADAEGDEDEGVEFTLTLSAAAPEDVTVDWTASTESGDSASTADLATTKTGTVTITKGATTKKFTVPVNDDSTDEPDQTFTVTLSNPTPTSLAQLAADTTARGTIEDDDDPPTLTVADLDHDEGRVSVDVTVSLSEVSEKRVRFQFRQVDRTGDTASDADWAPGPTAFKIFSPGTVSGMRVAVYVVRDSLDEDDETLTVEAYNLQNATGSVADREATITIIDDDPTPTVTVADGAATEGDAVEFVVTLSAVSGRDVDVDYATSVATGDDAVSGTDFTAASGTLTIAAADSTATGTIEVQTTEDDASESAETFTLTISSPDNATLTSDTTATGTINNRATTADEPTTFAAAVGNAQVVLSWAAPDSASGVTRHEYQYKEGTGAYQGWVQIANSGVDGANEAGFTVTGLTNEVLHTFQLRAVNAQGESTAAEADPVTPTPGICGRTAKVHEIIVYYLGEGGVERTCAEVNVADLESFTVSLEMAGESIGSLKSGDFAGLTNVSIGDSLKSGVADFAG